MIISWSNWSFPKVFLPSKRQALAQKDRLIAGIQVKEGVAQREAREAAVSFNGVCVVKWYDMIWYDMMIITYHHYDLLNITK